MYIIPWSSVPPTSLVSSTLSDSVAVWDAGTTYLQGALVYGSDETTVYEAAVGPATFSQGQYCGQEHGENLPNVGYDPEDNETVPAMDRSEYPDYYDVADCYAESGKLWWIKRGQYWENKYRLFSDAPDEVSQGPAVAGISSFSFTVSHDEKFTTIGLSRLNATSIRVQVSALAFDETFSLLIPDEQIFPGGDVYRTYALRLDLEVPKNAPITITVTHDVALRRSFDPDFADTARLGYLSLGYAVKFGETLYGTSVSIMDYSKKERDAFGRADVTVRNYTNIIKYRLSIPTDQIYSAYTFLSYLRASNSLYIGDITHPETAVVGFFKNFTIPIEGYTDSIFELEVEGI